MHKGSYDCRRLPDGTKHEALPNIGDFAWCFYSDWDGGEHIGLRITLPDRDGKPNANWLPVVRGKPAGECWGWDGNVDRPTLEPSIRLKPEQWHGHLKHGRLENCEP